MLKSDVDDKLSYPNLPGAINIKKIGEGMSEPIFIVSSGRSGTQMIAHLLANEPNIEAHHEFLCTHVQIIACQWALGKISKKEALESLRKIYWPALIYADAPLFADSSNKLSWVIDLLSEIFPCARFVYTVRDGRKVASSYFHKLADECYDDRSSAVLAGWIDGTMPAPPPEKKYWWPQPSPENKFATEEFRKLDRFGRICWHWGEINRRICTQLEVVPKDRQFFCRLEDLVSQPAVCENLWRFIGLVPHAGIFENLQRPYNVNRPEDHLLNAEQVSQVFHQAGDMMLRFGYDQTSEYRMTYGQPMVKVSTSAFSIS